MTESGSPVSRFLITVLIQYLREIRGSIPSASYHANRGSHRFWMVRPVSARASEICDDGYSRGCNWRAADESHCQFQSHCGWIELRVHYRAENNLSGPTRTGPAKDHDRGREGLHPTGAPHGTFAHLVGFNQDYKTAIHMHPKETDRGAPGCAGWTGTGVSYFMRCGPASFVFSLKCKSKGVHDSLLSASGSRHEPRVNLKLVYRNLATPDARHPPATGAEVHNDCLRRCSMRQRPCRKS